MDTSNSKRIRYLVVFARQNKIESASIVLDAELSTDSLLDRLETKLKNRYQSESSSIVILNFKET